MSGTGPQYPWGGLYGGQIVAQALRAATLSVDSGLEPHSIRAYFIRRGDHNEPVRYEVDRIRNGRSFATRRVVARQAIGAILNAESSFQRPEPAPQVQTVAMPEVPRPDELVEDSWSTSFERVFVPPDQVSGPPREGAGRVGRLDEGECCARRSRRRRVAARCTVAGWPICPTTCRPTRCLRRFRSARDEAARESAFCASLDHTIWFHGQLERRSLAPLRLHLRPLSSVVGAWRIGHVFADDGAHVATVAQEVLVRDGRATAGTDAHRLARAVRSAIVAAESDLPAAVARRSNGCAPTCSNTR